MTIQTIAYDWRYDKSRTGLLNKAKVYPLWCFLPSILPEGVHNSVGPLVSVLVAIKKKQPVDHVLPSF